MLSHTTTDCYIYAESRRVSTVGVEGLIVIETADAVLIAHRDSVQDVKAVVTALNAAKRQETVNHLKVIRPWGSCARTRGDILY